MRRLLLVVGGVLFVAGVIVYGLGYSTASEAKQASDSAPVQISAQTEDEMRAKVAQANENTRRVQELSAQAEQQKTIGGILAAAGAITLVAGFLSGRQGTQRVESIRSR